MPASEPTPDVDTPGRSPWLLPSLVAVIALLIGVGIGLMIALGIDESEADADDPAADSVAVGFAQDMIRHHEQGVEMSIIEITDGTDPQVRSMAFDIMTVQSNEIGQMQSWLSRWNQPFINPSEPMLWMPHDDAHSSHDEHGSEHHTDHTAAPEAAETPVMPGMATASEMNRLRTLRGPEVDIYFLQLMLRHHEGGLHMMEYAADPDHVSQPYVRDLAAGMLRTQEKEIATIKQMLTQRGAEPLPMN